MKYISTNSIVRTKGYNSKFVQYNNIKLKLKASNDDGDDDDYSLRDYDSLGIFKSFAEDLDKKTGGFALKYADISPYKPSDTVGISFLATNLFYIAAGIDILNNNQPAYAGIIETAGVISSYYHFNQLYYGPGRAEVRIALLIDYFCASLAIIATIYQYATVFFLLHVLPVKALLLGIVGVSFLLLSWKYEQGLKYIIFHGSWHVFSALSAAEAISIMTNG